MIVNERIVAQEFYRRRAAGYEGFSASMAKHRSEAEPAVARTKADFEPVTNSP